jgi:putative MFS transporter
MAAGIFARGERAHPGFFWLGALAVTVGVGLHLPMYVRSASMNFHVAGMPVDATMLTGMALIIGGTAASWHGLLPATPKPESPGSISAALSEISAQPLSGPEGELSWAHWQLLLMLTLAVVIDAMKPASLGFVVPGTAQEYGLSREIVALFPFCALTGLTIGSYVWGVIADRVGRRAAILLSGIC